MPGAVITWVMAHGELVQVFSNVVTSLPAGGSRPALIEWPKVLMRGVTGCPPSAATITARSPEGILYCARLAGRKSRANFVSSL